MQCPLHPKVKLKISISTAGGGDSFQDILLACPKHVHGYCVRVRKEDLLPDTRPLPDASFEDKQGKSLTVGEEGAFEAGSC